MILLVFYGAWMLIQRFAFEAAGPLNADSGLYITVGRGILHGLMPYVDLYENKPPGIFLLYALSLNLTDGIRLVSWIDVVALLSVWLSIMVPGILYLRKRTISQATLFSFFCFATLLTLYTAEKAGQSQVESFGAAFACGYVSLIAFRGTGRVSFGQFVAASFCILGSVLMKEPFALVLLASSLLLLPRFWDFCSKAVLPIACAAIIFVAGLWLSGLWMPYVDIYLHNMLGGHIHRLGSPWLRGIIGIDRTLRHLVVFNIAFAAVLGGLILTMLAQACRSVRGVAWRRLVVVVLSLYLTSSAIGLGGQFYEHHYVFAVPYYSAVFLFVMRTAFRRVGQVDKHRWVHCMNVVLVIGMILSFRTLHYYESRLTSISSAVQETQTVSLQIDSILEKCHINRYLFIGQNYFQPYAFTTHLPLGPLFYQYDFFFVGAPTWFTVSFEKIFDQANIVVMAPTAKLEAALQNRLKIYFTVEPWDCADTEHLSHGYRMFFRKNGSL